MRIIVIGASGQVGQQLMRAGLHVGQNIVGWSSSDVDITDAAATAEAIERAHPDVVINCAAYTAVDRAETDYRGASAVNVIGAGNVAGACARSRSHLVHVSTDYIFSGSASTPYEVDEQTGPHTVYGKTKLAGELAVRELLPTAHIVRTSWVFTGVGSDFVATMLRLEKEREHISVVDDQWGSPTYSADLAAGLLELALQQRNSSQTVPTTLHATNAGVTTWCGLAKEVFASIGADPERIVPCTTEDFPRPAPRPTYSALSGTSWVEAGLRPLRHWREAVRDAVHNAVTATEHHTAATQ
ncbi:dTDP-4-dehydrorhamnose reductase [Hoyosella rhizosphaerae]|uniref:dTDP-4-dehydrorhamnose reductase n=1 Tax=Hoyosella rhizosphaerae TaxID=1755582 RepID=UPI001669FB68|nr:dTDP-4-dehydrorhamnose reductase [Hoyosella rhizosphaerae]MBN4926014.1 dTDP-4-dehydrorhamnose reductase [Hoyosella rhizosphaerae]